MMDSNNNSLTVKEKILSLNQMLLQVKHEEEQLLKHIKTNVSNTTLSLA